MNTTDLSKLYQSVRRRTLSLTENLSAEDCCVQSMPDASPAKWHLGHTTWFFETFILESHEEGYSPFSASFRKMFNSYYQSVGDKHPRPERGLLTRSSLAEVLAYRAHVDKQMLSLLSRNEPEPELHKLIILGINHEQQHQELIQIDIKHLFSRNPLFPAYVPHTAQASEQTPELTSEQNSEPSHQQWLAFTGGVVEVGHDGIGFAFDNETPRHRVFLEPYALASRLVTNAEYAEFIRSGGYADPGDWLSEGWEWRSSGNRQHPFYWHTNGDAWKEFTLQGLRDLDPHALVLHVSYFEADAYAPWADARLPTEAEWEHACV
jgi:ergothioneine biosynthesis protein EgtB